MEDHYLKSGGVYRGGLPPQVGGGGPIGEDYHLRSGGGGRAYSLGPPPRVEMKENDECNFPFCGESYDASRPGEIRIKCLMCSE